MTTPKLYFWPGICTSSAWSAVICRKDAGVGAALVVLPGGVQKARAEAQAGGHALLVAHLVPEALDGRLVLGEHGQKSQRGKVVAGMNLIQMRAQNPGQRCARRRSLELGGVGVGGIEADAAHPQGTAVRSGSLPVFS